MNISHSRFFSWVNEESPVGSPFHKVVHAISRTIFITVKEFNKNELSLRAAALTFTIMLSLVPMLAMSTAVVKGLGGGNQLKKAVYSYIETLEPSYGLVESDTVITEPEPEDQANSNLTEHLYSAVDKIFDYVDRTNFATLGTFGVLGMFLSVVLVLGNIEAAMNSIWNVVNGRSIMRKIADYLALIILMPISINIGIAAGTVLKSEALLSKFSILLPMVWVQAIILKLIPIFFLSITLYVIYLFFPHTKVKSIPAMTGALFAGFFWFEVQNLYIGLQVGVSKYNAIYGSFATLPLFLTWIYCGWLFILAGAQLAYAFQHKDNYQIKQESSMPSQRLSIAFDLVHYVHRCFKDVSDATFEGFQEIFPMHQYSLVKQVLEELVEQKLIHLSEGDGTMKPSVPVDAKDQNKIITAILGSSFTETDGGNRSSEALHAAAASFAPQKTENLG